MKFRRLMVVAAVLLGAVNAVAADPAEIIADALKKSGQGNQRLSYCILLAKANAPAGTITQVEKKKAIEAASQKLKMNDPLMMRARADVARLGLYGFPKDENLALRLYLRVSKSPEAAWNAAFMIYRNSREGLSQEHARLILDALGKSGVTSPNAKGLAASYAGYVAGKIEESGAAGNINVERSFVNYRKSARNGYVPGMYHYMRQLYLALHRMQKNRSD